MQKHLLYLAFGTNLGEKYKNIEDAYSETEKRIGEIISQSAFYVSDPHGFESKNKFVNTVCAISTPLPLHEVFVTTQEIEKKLGRTDKSRQKQYTDRIIDIDILMYDDWIVKTVELTIPHDQLHKRRFVLVPFAEIAPQVVHPVFGKSILQLAKELDDSDNHNDMI